MEPLNINNNTTNIDWNPELTALNARLDKLEQEIQWTREMIDILEEHIKNMRS